MTPGVKQKVRMVMKCWKLKPQGSKQNNNPLVLLLISSADV